MPVLNHFLKVKGTFETSIAATVKSPPTLLLHFRLHSIELVAHFTIVQQLMAEYYHEADSRLLVKDLPFNMGPDQAVNQWSLDAASLMGEILSYKHVVVFITTHSDPESGDLWFGHDEKNEPFAGKVSDVSN